MTDYNNFTIYQLKDLLHNRGLREDGDLIQQLKDDDFKKKNMLECIQDSNLSIKTMLKIVGQAYGFLISEFLDEEKLYEFMIEKQWHKKKFEEDSEEDSSYVYESPEPGDSEYSENFSIELSELSKTEDDIDIDSEEDSSYVYESPEPGDSEYSENFSIESSEL